MSHHLSPWALDNFPLWAPTFVDLFGVELGFGKSTFSVFQNKVSLWGYGYPGTHSVDQASLQFGDLPASASLVLGLKMCERNTFIWTIS